VEQKFCKTTPCKVGFWRGLATINRCSNQLIFGVASNPHLRRTPREFATGGRLETHRCEQERRNSTITSSTIKRRQSVRRRRWNAPQWRNILPDVQRFREADDRAPVPPRHQIRLHPPTQKFPSMRIPPPNVPKSCNIFAPVCA